LLSELTPENAALVAEAWPGIDDRRRRRVVQELLVLAEDNVELNFDRVFIVALDDSDAAVRANAIKGLWEHESSDLIPTLIRLLTSDDSADVRAEAALALGRFVLVHEMGRVRDSDFAEIESALRSVLDNSNEVAEVRGRALEASGPHDAPWVRQAIHAAYESGVRGLKVSAVHAMGRSAEPRWLPIITRELSNEEAEVRYEAALAAGALGDASALPHLARLLSDPDDEVRAATIAALGSIGGEEARAVLDDLLDNPSEIIREAAREALAEIDFEEDPISFRHRLN
jgi:HEAT repeat protein